MPTSKWLFFLFSIDLSIIFTTNQSLVYSIHFPRAQDESFKTFFSKCLVYSYTKQRRAVNCHNQDPQHRKCFANGYLKKSYHHIIKIVFFFSVYQLHMS